MSFTILDRHGIKYKPGRTNQEALANFRAGKIDEEFYDACARIERAAGLQPKPRNLQVVTAPRRATVVSPRGGFDVGPPSRAAEQSASDARGVYTVAIDGREPDWRTVRAVERALERIAPRHRLAWEDLRGRVEVVAADDARKSPRFGGRAWDGGIVHGFACLDGRTVVIADDPEASGVVLHEIAHALDMAYHVSQRPAWLKLWRAGLASKDAVPSRGQNESPREYLAECFRRTFSCGSETVPGDVREYIINHWFASC